MRRDWRVAKVLPGGDGGRYVCIRELERCRWARSPSDTLPRQARSPPVETAAAIGVGRSTHARLTHHSRQAGTFLGHPSGGPVRSSCFSTSCLRVPLAALVAAVLVASCGDASGPASTRPAFRLRAVSPVVIEGVVSRAVAAVPSVLVVDDAGTPLVGQKVVFSLVSGGGAIRGNLATTDSRGIATLAEWTLGPVSGLNMVVAVSGILPPIFFRANGAAGALASIAKVAGDDQTAEAGSAIAARPQVRVTDVAGNPIHDLPVTFSIVSGGGYLVDGVVRSDSAGIATPGEWRLGGEGVQRLEARAGDLPPLTFTAMALTPTSPCPVDATLPQDETLFSTLTSASCQAPDGSFYRLLRVRITHDGAYRFTLSSTEFDTALDLRGGHLLASNDNLRGTTNSAIKAFLTPGTYTLVVRSATFASVGTFFLRMEPTTDNVDGCEDVFMVRGILNRQLTTSTDCPLGEVEHTDRFFIYLLAGAQVTIEAEDLSYSDHPISISTREGAILSAAQTSSGYVNSLTFIAPVSAFYRVDIANRGDDGAAYILKVR